MYKPSYSVDKQRLHAYGHKVLAGTFVGYVQHAGGGWTGDVYVIDQEEICNAEFKSEVTVKRFKADEVIVMQEGGSFRFPMLEYDLKQPGGRPPYVRKKRQPAARELVPLSEQQSSSGPQQGSAEARMQPIADLVEDPLPSIPLDIS